MADNPYDYIAEAITGQWGERCPDYEPQCACCAAWAQYDALKARVAVPRDWRCVPAEPTPAMLRSATGLTNANYAGAAINTRMRDAYKCMLDEAPELPNDPT